MPRYFRKVWKITAWDSPNVKLGLEEQRRGLKPSNRVVLPGVLTWAEFQKRLATWDTVRACIGLRAQFWEGQDNLLFPPDWLNAAEEFAAQLDDSRRRAKAIGIDPAEGGDKTAMVAVDEWGVLDVVARKTPDTSVILGEALAFMRKHDVPPHMTAFDRGGGGKQIADLLRANGHNVRTIAFGESVLLDLKRARIQVEVRMDNREDKYVYLNRRAQMYGELRERLNPSSQEATGLKFGIPARYTELRRQLAPMPLLYDQEGRMRMLPKDRREGTSQEDKCLKDLLGCSPDEADALVLAVYVMTHPAVRNVASAF